MKKIRYCLLFLSLLFAILGFSVYAESDNQIRLMDVNFDGKIDYDDARLMLRAAARLESLNEEQFCAADVNDDGKITCEEARATLSVAMNICDEKEAAELACGFEFDYVCVLLKEEYSVCPSPKYPPEYFSEKYIAYTSNYADLTPEIRHYYPDDFQQIIFLYLKEPSRDNVKKAFEEIKSKDFKEVEDVYLSTAKRFKIDPVVRG